MLASALRGGGPLLHLLRLVNKAYRWQSQYHQGISMGLLRIIKFGGKAEPSSADSRGLRSNGILKFDSTKLNWGPTASLRPSKTNKSAKVVKIQ